MKLAVEVKAYLIRLRRDFRLSRVDRARRLLAAAREEALRAHEATLCRRLDAAILAVDLAKGLSARQAVEILRGEAMERPQPAPGASGGHCQDGSTPIFHAAAEKLRRARERETRTAELVRGEGKGSGHG
jgi:hypothetical protein